MSTKSRIRLMVFVVAIGVVMASGVRAEYATIRGTPVTQGQMRVAEDDLPRVQQAKPASGDQFLLKETRVDAEISGVVARVRVEQVFQNPFSERLEAVYVFPLPEDAAVDRYWFQVGEKVIRGVVRKREEARAAYEQAKHEGRKAALLEEDRPDIFTQSVANILPSQEITVHLEYVHPVQIDGDRYLFRFPMVVGPRYIPGQAVGRPNVGRGWLPDTDQVPDASRVTPEPMPQGMRNGNDVKIRLRLDAGMPLQNIVGVSHELEMKKESETLTTLTLKSQKTIADKDFVVEYRLAGADTVLASLAHRGPAGGYFALVLQPKWKIEKAELAPREVVLLLDRSGSMNGPSISQLRVFAQHVLDHLNPQDTFRVVAFNNTAQVFRSEPLSAAPEHVGQAKEFVRGLNACGGTEMLPALQAALGNQTAEQARVRYLVMVTDALVGNDDAILGYLNRPEFRDVRVFPVAVGAAPNHYLVSRAAEIGRGVSMQVTNQDNAADMAKRFNARMSSPYMTDLEIDWGKLKMKDVTPEILPDLYAGRPLVVLGRFEEPGKGEITLKGNVSGQAVKTTLQITLPEKMSEHDSLGPMWAEARIRQIWNRNVGRETPRSREEITQLGLTHQLVTRYTSFVAIEMDTKALAKGNMLSEFVQPLLPEGMTDAAIGLDCYRASKGVHAGTQTAQAPNAPVTAARPSPAYTAPASAPAVPVVPAPSCPASGGRGGCPQPSHSGGGGGGSVEWIYLVVLGGMGVGKLLTSRRRREDQ